jgi:hypothetical protein
MLTGFHGMAQPSFAFANEQEFCERPVGLNSLPIVVFSCRGAMRFPA